MHGLFIRGLLEWINIFTFILLIHYLCFSGRSAFFMLKLIISILDLSVIRFFHCFILVCSSCLFLLFIFRFLFPTFVCFCCSSFALFFLRLFGEKQTDQWLIEKAIVGNSCWKISPYVLSKGFWGEDWNQTVFLWFTLS